MNSKIPKALFICDKWCDGRKEFGLSAWDMGLQDSLKSIGIAEVSAFHLDDYYFQTGAKGDEALLQKIKTDKPDIIFFITNALPGTAIKVPDFSTLDEIKNVLKVPMVAIWGDLEIGEQVQMSKALLPYTVINPSAALSSVLERINRPDKYLFMWVPRDPRIFNNPNKVRDIDVSYVGTQKKDRLKKVNYLKNHGINVVHGGGERGEHLTTEQYADRYQRSKITLSFSRASASHVINARPFEAMPCGAMLLEQESFETMKFYTPYVDYVPYSGNKDMLIKARYYLTHDEERAKIARSGQEKSERLYSAKRFWQIVIDKTLGTNSGQVYSFTYPIPQESLAQLSPFTAFKLKFLNSLCSTHVGFVIYRAFNWRFWQDTLLNTSSKIKFSLEKMVPKKVFDKMLAIKRKIY
jgi:hypothetical protein